MQFLVPRIVMVPQKVVRFHDFHVLYLRGLQNFLSAFRAGDVSARPHLTPFAERAGHTNLRPNPDDQRNADVKQPVRTKTETIWIKHADSNLMRLSQLSLCRSELDAQLRCAFIPPRVCFRATRGTSKTERAQMSHAHPPRHKPREIHCCAQNYRACMPDQISRCFGKRDRILQRFFVTNTTSSKRTPPSPG